jgi:L-malate glycosyltransferase
MPRARRVLYVEFNEDHTVGGSHRAVFDLVRHLPRERYEPIVLYYQENVYAERLRALGVRVIVVDDARRREREANATRGYVGRRTHQLWGIWWRRQLLRRERIDLVHLNGSPLLGADDWLPAARLTGIPCLVTALSIMPPTQGRVHRALFQRFDMVIAISQHVESSLRALGVPAARIRRVYLGVDIDELRARAVTPRETVRRSLGVCDDTALVVMVGNIRHWKGQHVVLAAVAAMPAAVQRRLRLVFVGAVAPDAEAYAAELMATVEAAGLRDVVAFLGARTDVPDLLAAADVAVHASVRPEPFGLVVPEAMALGAAVIAARDGGPAEIVTPTTGLLFDPASPAELAAHLTALVLDPDRRHALGRAAPERAEDFSIAHHVAGNLAVYDAL